MEKRYTFLPENWFRPGLLVAFATILTLNTSAQTAPNIQWDKTSGGNNIDHLRSMQQTTDGGFILGGISNSGISGNKSQTSKGGWDYWIVKTDGNGNKIWDRTFGGNEEEDLYAVKQTFDGGFILGGNSASGISGDKTQASKGMHDCWLIKLDSNGNIVWNKSFGGTGVDRLYSIQQTFDGGFILGGSSTSGANGDKSQSNKGAYDYWAIKVNINGNKQWDRTFGGTEYEYLRSIIQTSDGGYLLGGESDSGLNNDKSQASRGGFDMWVIKLDPIGNKIWDKTIGGSSNDYLRSLIQTKEGGFMLSGFSDSPISSEKSQSSNGGNDYWILKLDPNGNITWDKTFGGNNEDILFSIEQSSDEGFILAGHSNSNISIDKSQVTQGAYDFWVIRLNKTGNKVWDKTIGGSNNDLCFSMQRTSDNGYILGGYSDSNISGDKSQQSQGFQDYWIVKLAADVTGIKEAEANFALSISPNPNQGKFTLQLSNLTATKAEITVSDLLGRVVLKQPLSVSNKQISEELTLPYAKGMYLLQVNVGEQLLTRKILVE
ncbi:T9SS type A sorting domain-containing protein [Adhaeribacter sp. BT258]|uniref:T9SS type A sorting domain-containing protein n=1 Tax=Adhaeribacter terrigena TaxID=2793070 RepID=A0ABS1C285_9BACT|nr:T9SS type A sorting domain-containing protein [Adhaeribacter terrigena]MBK0403509.1 T9SS type A sorting domain-containing protein [Adhaeribacter terrigena]